MESIGEAIEAAVARMKSAEMKQAATAWGELNHILYKAKDKTKRVLAYQVIDFLALAREAYDNFNAQYLDERDRVVCANAYAIRCMTHYKNIREILRGEDVVKYQHPAEVNSQIDRVADWLETVGWFGKPKPIYPDGSVKVKTAAMVVADMEKFQKARLALMAVDEDASEKKR